MKCIRDAFMIKFHLLNIEHFHIYPMLRIKLQLLNFRQNLVNNIFSQDKCF